MSKKENRSSFEQALVDATELREIMLENAKDQLSERFAPQLERMFSDIVEAEEEDHEDHDEEEMDEAFFTEGDEEDDEEEEEEVELDLDEGEDHDEGEDYDEDDEDLDLDEIMGFLEAVSDDDRHANASTADARSEDNPNKYDDNMLDTGQVEDGGEQDMDEPVVEGDIDVADIIRQLTEESEDIVDVDDMIEAFLDEKKKKYKEEEDYHYDEGSHHYNEEDEDDYHYDEAADATGRAHRDSHLNQHGPGKDRRGTYEGRRRSRRNRSEDQMLEIDLNEFGSGSVTQPPRRDNVSLSDPYLDLVNDLEDDGLYVDTDPYDPEAQAAGRGDNKQQDLNTPLAESSLLDLIAEMEDEDEHEEELEELRQENKKLRRKVRELSENLNEHREAVTLLRNQINEVNLINSKLLYTNRLMKRFNLSEDQKLKVIEAFDMTSDAKQAKLVYATLNESFNVSGVSRNEKQRSKKDNERSQLKESLSSFLSGRKQNSTKPSKKTSKQILSEDAVFDAERLQKLANVKGNKKR